MIERALFEWHDIVWYPGRRQVMQGVLNEAAFAAPEQYNDWLMQAMGRKTEHSAQVGGLRDPREMKIRRGSSLFRIGHSRSADGAVPDAINLSRPWWVSDEAFEDMCQSATTLGMGLQRMARFKLSVSERFGVFDTLFWVITKEPLGAYRGLGVPVYGKRRRSPDRPPAWAWPGTEVPQYFIPGLCTLTGKPTGLAEQAFYLHRRQPVYDWLQVRDGPSGGS